MENTNKQEENKHPCYLHQKKLLLKLTEYIFKAFMWKFSKLYFSFNFNFRNNCLFMLLVQEI